METMVVTTHKVILATRPLKHPPPGLVPIVVDMAGQSTMLAVHARAILSSVASVLPRIDAVAAPVGTKHWRRDPE